MIFIAKSLAADTIETLQTATTPFAGYRDRNSCSVSTDPARFLEDIRTPYLVLAAQDDPIVPPECMTKVTRNHRYEQSHSILVVILEIN